MDNGSIDHARCAGEAFVAASRAATAEQRAAFGAEAERHVDMLRQQEQARIQAMIDSRTPPAQ